MTLRQEQQQRSCPRGLTAASRPRLPLQERPNPPSATPGEKKGFLGPTESSFPCSKDPVPDAPIDYTELWKAVSMTKPPDADKASSRGTEAYGGILYRLGIDVDTDYDTIASPEGVIDLSRFKSPPIVDYPNLKTDDQLQALADKHKRYAIVPNEATLAARMMSQIFTFDDIPDPGSSERSCVPCQILEFRSAFTGFDRFNERIYSYVRGSKEERALQPSEGPLRSRSDLTIMAYKNAMGRRFRRYCDKYPGVHKGCSAIAPFLSIEFKKVSDDPAKVRESDTPGCHNPCTDDPMKVREATHQIAISSYVNLVERQRLPRSPQSPYIRDENIRHYAYTICGNEVMVWVTTLQLEKRHNRFYNTYKVRKLQVLDLAAKDDLEEFLRWHRHIITWGLAVYVPEYVKDLELYIGGAERKSLVQLILSRKKVTGPVNSEGIPEGDESDYEAENLAAEGPATEDLMSEEPIIDDPAIEDLVTREPAIGEPAIEDPAIEGPAAGGPATENPAARRGKSKAVEHVSSSTVIRNLLYRRLNEAATSSRKIADNAAVKTYLNKLIEDIRKFIRQLEDEGEGRHANVKGEHALSSKVAKLQAPRTASAQSRIDKRASPRGSSTSTNRHGNAEKQPFSAALRPRWK
jgi:hypothetical protein